ncbi:unnamed protein product [Symbiodinium natans]|uniref:Uncharacterized protein n=1 Tax=Symbiodinium natans TaxID=878477 RepID=A0A812TTE3_9DINO|nr:unnamed protein product [Symbiodinium natans]
MDFTVAFFAVSLLVVAVFWACHILGLDVGWDAKSGEWLRAASTAAGYILAFYVLATLAGGVLVILLGVVFSCLALSLIFIISLVTAPFLVSSATGLGRCHFDRAVMLCLPVPGSNDAIPISYCIFPAYLLKWLWHLYTMWQLCRAERPSEETHPDQGKCRSWACWPCEVLFQLLDTWSDVSVALGAWSLLPMAWSVLFAPTVLLSISSFCWVASQKPVSGKTNPFWIKLQLCEDILQSALALVGIFLYSRAGAPQEPFMLTTLADSLLRCFLQFPLLQTRSYADRHLILATDDTWARVGTNALRQGSW